MSWAGIDLDPVVTEVGGPGQSVECGAPRQESIKTNSDKQTNTWSPGPRRDLSVRTILQEFDLKFILLKNANLNDRQVRWYSVKAKQRLKLMERFKCQAYILSESNLSTGF